jgi:hypothetical protein
VNNPYRVPAPKPVVKKESLWAKFKKGLQKMFSAIKEQITWALFDSPIGVVLGLLLSIGIIAYASSHEAAANRMHAEHDQYVLRQEICRIHRAWYTPSQNYQAGIYHDMMACRRLSDHSLFYVVETTGLELNPHEMGVE